MNKKVSIIIATYNRAAFIATTLNSILNQTFSNFEVIIVDDGGNDASETVLKDYLVDSRFTFYKRPESHAKGCPGSRNYGLTKANGDFIWFFDDDDIAHPKLLEYCVEAFKNNENDFCRFRRTVFYDLEKIIFDEKENPLVTSLSKLDLKAMILGKIPFNSCQVLWRKASLGNRRFKENIIYSDDWEFYSDLLSQGFKGVSIDKILLYARKHAGSATERHKQGNKEIKNSMLLANYSVIDRAVNEGILDKDMFRFFYRKALLFKSYKLAKYLIEKSNLSFISRAKYTFGFIFFPFIKPIFNLKSKFSTLIFPLA